MMAVAKLSAFLFLVCTATISLCFAIQHKRNLIWAQTPAMRLSVSRLVGIEGDPKDWATSKKPSVKHISAPHFGWEFKALGFSFRKRMLVWSEAMNKKIQALVLNGSTETIDIFTGTSSEVNGVVVDWINSNVYWTDALYNWVIMAPLRPYSSDRVYRIIVQDGLDNPHGLAVHPAYNWLLLSDWGVRPRIEMMDLLGKNRKVMVDKDILQPRGMVIDMQKLRLYWVDSRKGTVESIFLRTFDLHRSVIRTDSGTRFFDIAVFQDYLFVTEQSQGLLKIIRQDSSEDIVSFTLGNVPYGIVMYDQDMQPGQIGGCEEFGCEHMCVENPKTGPTCLCGEGYDLMDNMLNCVLRKQFLHPSHLYAIGVAICMYPANIADMSLDNVSLTSQCILSDRYGYLALTFDAAENVLYYSGNYTNTISAIPLETGAKAKVVASGTGVVKGLALDWVVGTLYWTDSTNAYIKMSRKDGRFQQVLIEKDVNNPLGIAVHPGLGKIYWTDIGFQPDVPPKIESANMDGSEREVLVKENLGQPNHLLIDYNTDKLYWADSILNHIREYDLKTRDWKVFYSLSNVKFYGLSLYKDYVLWTDADDMNGIHVARMDTERKVRGIIHPNYGVAADLITFDPLLQPDLKSPCKDSQCGQLCLPRGSDNFTCSCGLGFVLSGRSECDVGNFTKDNFIIVNDAYQRNMYQVDSKSGAITAMSQGEAHEPIAIDMDNYRGNIIYWSDNTAHVIRRKPLGLHMPYSFIDLPEVSVVDGIAVDSQNQLLFFTDTGRDIISAVTTHTSPPRQTAIVTEGLEEPRDIVVSPLDGMIYWSDWGNNASISEARMNGDERRVIVHFNQSAWPNGLAIDIKGRALYWADARNNDIGMYHLDTRQQRILLREPSAHYFGLFVMGDYLYVTDWKRRFVARMHKLGGELMQFGEAKFTKLYGITGYNSSDTLPGGLGICANQSKCDNVSLCLPTTARTFVCVCMDGYERVGRTCQKVTTTTTTTTTATTTTETNTTTNPSTTSATATATTHSTDRTSDDFHWHTTTITRDHGDGSFPVTRSDDDDDEDNDDSNDTKDGHHDVSDITTTAPRGESSDGSGESGGNSTDGGKGGGGLRPQASENKLNTPSRTGIIVASTLAGVALLVAAVVAVVLHFRRRRGYQVPHTRLREDGKGGSTQTSPPTSASASLKVTYARHNSSDSVHFDEGFENPTYDVTMAMLSDGQATSPAESHSDM